MGDLSAHFSRWEFACRCGECPQSDPAKIRVDCHFIDDLEWVRSQSGGPLYVHSGYRCAEHNKSVGSKETSQHRKHPVICCDCHSETLSPQQLARLFSDCEYFFQGGIGVYSWGVHADQRSNGPARWGKKWR